MQNPYASHLGNGNPTEVIAATAGRLDSLFHKLGAKGAEQSLAPGKWSAREILCHLADCELVFGFRLRQALAEDHHVIQPFDQDRWSMNYSSLETGTALAVFTSVRNWNLALIGKATPQMLSKTLIHPERGEMTFQIIIETMAGHDLNHLKQLETLAARQ
ncbi:MAG: DinB family protein [Candidatus Acidiferrales bacterium]